MRRRPLQPMRSEGPMKGDNDTETEEEKGMFGCLWYRGNDALAFQEIKII